jgi:holo-[acyl-carrier protein] synthase
MIIGIGIDLVDLKKFAKIAEKANFLDKYFSPDEAILKIESLAARYAAREAFFKALTEQKLFNWNDISVVSNNVGKPTFRFRNKLHEYAVDKQINLSLSHTEKSAIAIVIIQDHS